MAAEGQDAGTRAFAIELGDGRHEPRGRHDGQPGRPALGTGMGERLKRLKQDEDPQVGLTKWADLPLQALRRLYLMRFRVSTWTCERA